MKIQTPIDGSDTYGFPITFYTVFSGECVDCLETKPKISFSSLIIDVFVSGVLGLAIDYIIKRFKK
ncbi:hypothetical protein [Aegicerativicinus sediminis]|uniref:hypothetical protein n=1 Tax=Aegicerativicinus sediminis TaxID=2893202 RepID=UPI001E643E1B|nr:hypothetical protein [Aegicerativicinus sediminis]